MGRLPTSSNAYHVARQSNLAMRSEQSSPYTLRSSATPPVQSPFNQQAFDQMC